MSRKFRCATIGSISSGTMRAEDLIPTFTDELRTLMRGNRLPRDTRRNFAKLIREADAITDWNNEECYGILEDLFDALQWFAPCYVTFGAHEGDGSDFGFWPSIESLEDDARAGEVLKVDDTGDVPKRHSGYVMQVSDHGNVTLYRFFRGRNLGEVWSCA